jgi:hypothetical protein
MHETRSDDAVRRWPFWKSAVLTVIIGALIVVVAVLPAEKGVDPTGIGRMLGLTQMGELKQELAAELAYDNEILERARLADSADAAEAAAMEKDSASSPAFARDPSTQSDISTITVPANGSFEFMLPMQTGARVRYSWSTAGPPLDYAVMGDSTAAGTASALVYSRGFGKSSKIGVIVAEFDGRHGWYWRNTTDSAVTLTLQTSGDYAARGGGG